MLKHSLHVWPLKAGLSEGFEKDSVPESCGFCIFLLAAAEQCDTESSLLILRQTHTHTPAFIFHLHWLVQLHFDIHTSSLKSSCDFSFTSVQKKIALKLSLNFEK